MSKADSTSVLAAVSGSTARWATRDTLARLRTASAIGDAAADHFAVEAGQRVGTEIQYPHVGALAQAGHADRGDADEAAAAGHEHALSLVDLP